MAKKKQAKKFLKKRKSKGRQTIARKNINGNNHRIVMLAKLKKAFNEIDVRENRRDIDYNDETNRVYDLLMQEFPYEPENLKDRVIYDIVIDIFRACGKEIE